MRMKRGRTAASTLYPDLNSVRPSADSTLPGLECLPADFCRSLGDISARPSALSDPLLGWSGGQEARVRAAREDGLCGVPLLAVWPGHAPGGHERQTGAVLTVRPSPCRQLAAPCNHGIGMWRITTIRYTGT